MSKYNKETLQKLEKNKLIRLLEKEGIDASIHQPKTELIRLLMLAKRANAPSSGGFNFDIKPKNTKKIITIASIVGAILFMVLLYSFNSTFNKNINFLVTKITSPAEESPENFGPTIYEKGGKTFVVYDYPLIGVKAIYDPTCTRPECSLDSYYKQIENFITPLVNFTAIDYKSRQGQSLVDEYNLNLLPVFIFDTTIEKTANFENSKRNLEKVKDRYILQVTPNVLIKGPQTGNAGVITRAAENKQKALLVEYTGFSCKLCFDSYLAINSLTESLGDTVTRVVKYFNTSEKDFPASVAAECAGQQGKFSEYYRTLFDRQAEWVDLPVQSLNSKLIGFATELDISRNIFSSCLEDENTKQIVTNHFNEAGSLGISAAPTLIVNNNVLVGVYPEASLKKAVEDILNK
jgi:protein-disulfide isomerase